MTIGDERVLAIESYIEQAYSNHLSLRALGYFVIYVNGCCFGRKLKDSSYLACSLDEVQRRIRMRGLHQSPFSKIPDAAMIAKAYRFADFSDAPDSDMYFGLTRSSLSAAFSAGELVWAPDGDSAFDDGSYVLQFDIGSMVRVIGFKASDTDSVEHVNDVLIDADAYYEILNRWQSSFLTEWEKQPKETI